MTFEQWKSMFNISDEAMHALRTEVLLSPTKTTGEVVGVSEEGAQQKIRADAPQQCSVLWRNNVGAYTESHPPSPGTRWGLCNDSAKVNKKIKSSDLIGPTMISYHGRCFGVFTAIECKKPGWTFKGSDHENAQLKYHNIVRSYGGIAGFATCVADYQRIIREYLQ